MPEEQVALTLLKPMGVKLDRLGDIRKDVVVCRACFQTKIIPAATGYIRDLSSTEPSNLDEIGGIGELGIPDALFHFIEWYEVAQRTGSKKIDSIAYWVVTLAVKLLGDGTVSLVELTAAQQDAVIASLQTKMQSLLTSSPYHWSDRIDEIITLCRAGMQMPAPVVTKLKAWEQAAQTYQSTGRSDAGSWGGAGKQHAKEVLTKIASLRSDALRGRL